MASINLPGRIPVPRPAISGRLLALVLAVFVLLLCAVVYGFHYRLVKQQARKERQHALVVASDAAPSNRQSVEGEVPVEPLPGSTPPPASTAGSSVTAPLVNAVKAVAHPFPAQSGQVPAPVGRQTSTDPQTAPQTPSYYVPPIVPQSQEPDVQDSLRKQALQRRYSREQEAMEAPTGAQEQHTIAAAPMDPMQAEMAQLNGLLHPVGAAPMQGPAAGTPLASYPGSGAESGSGYRGQNAQGEKRRFQEGGEGPSDDYLKTTRTPPLSPWVVQRGTVIPAALPHRLISDLPGDLIAEVQRDVYDSPTQKYVMVPAGSRLVGEYDSSISYGQNRVQIVWIAIYFPDGSFIDLDRMPSHSADGAMGLKDQADNHWKRLIGGVALSSLLAAGLQVSQNHNSSVLAYPSTTQEIGAAVGTQASELGQQLTNRNLNIQPTLKIRAGEIFAVSVKKDLLFPGPYEALASK